MERNGPPAVAVSESGGVRVFARLSEGQDASMSEEAPPELLAQLVVVEEYPIVLLTLVSSGGDRPEVVRAALDARSNDGKTILESLRRRFAARVSLFGASGRFLGSIDVEAPREVNVARILERVSRMRTAAAVDAATAIDRVLSSPPPVHEKGHPFVDPDTDEAEAKNAEGARLALARMAEWSSHDKMDHALLVLSIPRDHVDGAVRRVIEQAMEHGLALPGRLPERALSLGVAPDQAALVDRQIAAFAKTASLADHGGLNADQMAENWERLLELAAENEVAIDTDTHEAAWSAIRAVRGGSGPDIDPAKLPEMGLPELVMLLDHPKHRRDAALEICRREDATYAGTLCKAARKMPRAEVVRVVPRITGLGEEAGDALIDGLGARKTFVRQAFALALGHLKLRRAVVPLVHLLASEETEVWRELARVVGTFGNASLRNVTRQLKDPKGNEERYTWTLAYLANHGCAKQVERLTSDNRPAVAMMASEALTLRDRAKEIEAQVQGDAPLPSGNGIVEFSRRYYQELEGRAPEDDLAEASPQQN